jgi:hypothetical protein
MGFAHHFGPTYALVNVGHPSIPSHDAMTQTYSGLGLCARRPTSGDPDRPVEFRFPPMLIRS